MRSIPAFNQVVKGCVLAALFCLAASSTAWAAPELKKVGKSTVTWTEVSGARQYQLDGCVGSPTCPTFEPRPFTPVRYPTERCRKGGPPGENGIVRYKVRKNEPAPAGE